MQPFSTQKNLHLEAEREQAFQKTIQAEFPGAMKARIFCNKLNLYLESKGFHPHSTVFCQGMSSDMLNEPELT